MSVLLPLLFLFLFLLSIVSSLLYLLCLCLLQSCLFYICSLIFLAFISSFTLSIHLFCFSHIFLLSCTFLLITCPYSIIFLCSLMFLFVMSLQFTQSIHLFVSLPFFPLSCTSFSLLLFLHTPPLIDVFVYHVFFYNLSPLPSNLYFHSHHLPSSVEIQHAFYSHKTFPNATKEISQVLISVFFFTFMMRKPCQNYR